LKAARSVRLSYLREHAKEKPQISPLRYAPVEMTILLWIGLIAFQEEMVISLQQIVISTGVVMGL
jgi:hypothetical protein